MVGSGNNVVDKINLVASGGFATLTGLKVRELGTALNGTDIASISFWRDTNANAPWNRAPTRSSAAQLLSTGGQHLRRHGSFPGHPLRVYGADPRGRQVAAGATTTRTIQTQVVDATYVTLSAGTVAGPFRSAPLRPDDQQRGS